MIAAVFFLVVGNWMRLLINLNYYLVFIGQTICSLSDSIVELALLIFVDKWFEVEKRGFAYTIVIIGQALGILFSGVIPTFFISEKNENVKDSDFFWLLTVKALIASSSILVAFLIKNEPKIASSSSGQL